MASQGEALNLSSTAASSAVGPPGWQRLDPPTEGPPQGCLLHWGPVGLAEALATAGLLVYLPPPQFQLPQRTLAAIVQEFAQIWPAEFWTCHPTGVGLSGMGLGGTVAMRLAWTDPQRFRILATTNAEADLSPYYGFGSLLDALYPSREACRQDSPLLQVDPHGLPEVWHAYLDDAYPAGSECQRGQERLFEKLRAAGQPADWARTPADPVWWVEQFRTVARRRPLPL